MSITRCRRRNQRYEIPPGTPASVEFELDGSRDRAIARLRDISSSGVQFEVALSPSELEPGQRLGSARIRLAGRAIAGELVVMHLSAVDAGLYACGALFYPAEDRDGETLATLLDQLVGEAG